MSCCLALVRSRTCWENRNLATVSHAVQPAHFRSFNGTMPMALDGIVFGCGAVVCGRLLSDDNLLRRRHYLLLCHRSANFVCSRQGPQEVSSTGRQVWSVHTSDTAETSRAIAPIVDVEGVSGSEVDTHTRTHARTHTRTHAHPHARTYAHFMRTPITTATPSTMTATAPAAGRQGGRQAGRSGNGRLRLGIPELKHMPYPTDSISQRGHALSLPWSMHGLTVVPLVSFMAWANLCYYQSVLTCRRECWDPCLPGNGCRGEGRVHASKGYLYQYSAGPLLNSAVLMFMT